MDTKRPDAEFIAHAREDAPWLLDEVERLREYIDRMPYPSDMDELRADRDHLAATVERVRALAEAGEDEPHNGHASFEGEPECPACWVASIEAALNEGDET